MKTTSVSGSDNIKITSELLKTNCVLLVKSQISDNVTYDCVLCKTKRLTETTLLTHIANLKHSEIVKRREDGEDKYTDTKYHGKCLQYSLECLLLDRCGSAEEVDKRLGIITELESIFQQQSKSFLQLEGVSVEMYGSSAFSAALIASDINCFLRVKEYLLCVKIVNEIITQYSEIYDPPTITSGNKFPRIRFRHKESGLNILMSVYSPKSENFTDLMNRLLGCDERALKLSKLLKIHCEEMNLMDGTFANHMFYILAVYFCQHVSPPLLPKFTKDYHHLMSKSEEDRCNREERDQRNKAEKLGNREEREKLKQEKMKKKDKTKLSAEDVAIENFAANVVVENLRIGLFRIAHERGIQISAAKIESILKDARVDDIFPEVTTENDPWNVGSSAVVDEGEGGWNAGWNVEQTGLSKSEETLPSKSPTEPSAPDGSTAPPLCPEGVPPQEGGVLPPTVDWNGVEEECKIKLSEWGEQYLTGVRQECYNWTPKNTKELHQLFQEMIRFFAKFSFENKTISICRSQEDPDNNKYSFVEDPFQPGTSLYILPNCGKNRKNKKLGKSRIYHEMTRHIKSVFEVLRHYYEGPHKKGLCLASTDYETGRLPPYSPFELAIRFEIPDPFTNNHGEPKQEKLPGLESVSQQALNSIGRIIDKISYKYKLSEKDDEAREQTFSDLAELVRRYVDSRVKPVWFGSSRNGLVLNTSDMDITLDVSSIDPVDPTHLLGQLAQVIKDNKVFILEEVILQARVPIIKFRRTDNDLSGDIAVGNLLAIANTRLIKAYTEIDEKVLKLGLVVKAVVKECGCADASTGSLSSYAYTMMVIYFLQQVEPPVIPVLQEINRPHDVTEYEVETWDTYFYRDIHKQTSEWPCENIDSVALLVLKFFKFYYEEFDYNKMVVAPKQRALLQCTDKNWFRPINIEDPFNLDHNLGKQVSTKTLDIIKTVFRQAYLRYSVGPLAKSDINVRYYLDKNYLLDGKSAPVNFICYGCGSRDHYISECPNKNRCSICNEHDHTKSNCPKITCFHCNGQGHMAGSCPNKKHKHNKRTSPDKSPGLDFYDRKNWIGQVMNPDIAIGKRGEHYKAPVSPAIARINNTEYRTNGDQSRRSYRSMSESSDAPDRQSKKKNKKKRTSSESKERADSNPEPAALFRDDFIPLQQWSDPHLVSTQPLTSGRVIHVTTKDNNKKQVPAKKVDKKTSEKIQTSTHMTFMGGNVTTPIPSQAKEDSRQKKSKSMVRKDIFGDNKPKVTSVNKKQTVKTSKVKVHQAFGAGRKATKTEIWEDPHPGVMTEGSRYGPKREEDDFAGDLAPDFFSPQTQQIYDPDPNNLSEWGDLTPSIAADPIMGAAMQQEIEPNWIDYLSSSPEKPAVKPSSQYNNQHLPNEQHLPSPKPQHVPFQSPPKTLASKQLLDQLHSSPSKGGNQKRGEGRAGGRHRQGHKQDQYQEQYQDPYLSNNNKRKNNRDTFVSEDVRYNSRDQRPPGGQHHQDNRQHHQDNRHQSRETWRDEQQPRDMKYRDASRGYHDSSWRGGGYRDDPRNYRDDAGRMEMNYREEARRDGTYYREEPRYQGPNSFMSGPSGYQPCPRRPNEPPDFDALKRRPGRGRGTRVPENRRA